MNLLRPLVATLMIVFMANNALATEVSTKQSIKIGIAGPFTGALASYGEKNKKGAQIALDEINAKGGLLGKPVEAIFADDACEPKQATSAANFLESHGVNAVVGHFCSPTSTVAAAIYNETGIVMIESAASDRLLTEKGYQNLFRTAIRSDRIGKILAETVEDKFKAKSVLVLSDQLNITKQVAESFRERYEKYPDKKIQIEYFKGGEKDYMPLASKVSLIRPDIIICSCFMIEAGIITKQLNNSGITQPIVGFDTMASPEYNQIAGNVKNSFFIAYSKPSKTDDTERLRQALAKEKLEDDIFASMAYTSVKILASAIQDAGSDDKTKLSKSLRTREFDSLYGKISFDSKGDRLNPPLSWYQWKNNRMIEVQPIITNPQ
ncbi:MAG: branched-chain amino acid ABC transporter substrate-binding protein [Alphaproteobacteria bacterium]|nr:branched-chain amino acid ABC transporter substrate-binding protein [Alphaproteobacteria bacterium]